MDVSLLIESPTFTLTLPDEHGETLSSGDPAVRAMTDLRLSPVSVTRPDVTIELALLKMKQAGVRFLFVCDPSDRLTGSITSYDIQGEKPLVFMQSQPAVRAWREIRVQDVMEPVSQWRVLDYRQLPRLSVGDIVTLLIRAGRRHLLVVESAVALPGAAPNPPDKVVRGIFSASRIERMLGLTVQIEPRPSTFAEFERVIA